MESSLAILSALRSRNIAVTIDEVTNGLKVSGNLASLSAADKENLKQNKEAIITFLKERKLKKQQQSFFKIPKAAASKGYALSNAQRRLWALSQFAEANIAYNMPAVYVLEGPLDVAMLERSFKTLIARHESLRTVFREDEEDDILQFILSADEIGFRVTHHDLRGEEAQEAILKQMVQKEYATGFNLANGPLLRATLYRLSDHKWVFTYIMHHIISDGWSMGVLIKELLMLYRAYVKGEPDPLPALDIQYKDYVAWQQQQLNDGRGKADKEYWLQQFEGELPVLEFPADHIRPAIKTYHGRTLVRTLDATAATGIRQLCRQTDCTLFMGLLTATTTLLYRYTGQEDIIIGSPVAGREHADLEGQIGFYVNTLALRMQFTGDHSFLQLLEKTRETTFGAYAHQLYPFDELVDALELKHELSRNALFDVMMVLQNFGNTAVTGEHEGGIRVSEYREVESNVSKFDLLFTFTETTENIQVAMQYNSAIYHHDSIERLADHLDQLLKAIVEKPSMPIQQLDYLSEAEKRQLVVDFNNMVSAYPAHKTVTGLFEEQVALTPDNIAVVFEEEQLTYRELNERSNQLAHYLRSLGVREDTLVPVCIERSLEMIVSVLGILKAGGAYVPIDAEYPEERIKYMLEDTAANVVISSTQCRPKLPEKTNFHLITIDEDREINRQSTGHVQTQREPHHLVYVIYTSGSTGLPKGVKMPGGGLVNLLTWQEKQFENRNRRVLQFSSLNFDVSFQEMFSTFCSGCTLCLIRADQRVDMAEMWKQIGKYKVTHIFLPSAVLNHLAEYMHLTPGAPFSLEEVIVAGDQLILTEPIKHLLNANNIRLINHYGPTETHIASSYTVDIHTAASPLPPIGKPLDNVRLYILKNGTQLVPPGVTGELYIGGVCIARGYLNRPALTGERFIPDPFNPVSGARMYKTGDLVRWLPDGNVEFLGRIDDQVKIRGYRVELGEIESAIQKHPAIDATVVVARTNKDGIKELVAYLVSREKLNAPDMRAHVSRSLPAYMMPAYFVQLDELPFSTNGKINKKKLPDPEELGLHSGVEYVAPRNETEEKLTAIWKEVLRKEKIGIKDSFFDLGGHSLKVTQLISRINKEFSVRMNIQSIFDEPTIENISDHILFVRDQKERAANRATLMEIDLL